MARPKKLKEEKRTSRSTIHWKTGELERITNAADLLGLPVSDFVRMASLDRARKVLEESGRTDLLMGRKKDQE